MKSPPKTPDKPASGLPSLPVGESGLASFAVSRRVTVSMIALGLVVLGYVSLTRLPLEFLPEFGSNSLWVSASYESSSPEETERLIVRPLEDSLGTIPGITNLSASASDDDGSVSLEFEESADMDLMVVEARDRVDRVRHLLPDDIERIRIRRFQSSDIPIMRFQLAAPWERSLLFDFAEDFVLPRLERIEGVASADVRGVRRRELKVIMDPQRMAALGVDVRDVSSVLSQNNVNVSGGDLNDGPRRLLVRTVGEFERPEDLRDTPLGPDGITVGDVAEVRFDFPEQRSFDFLNGEEAVSFQIYKASAANVLEVCDAVRAEMEAIGVDPAGLGVTVQYIHDSSLDVRGGLSELTRAGLFGGGLAILILLLFLQKVRTTLLVALAIPLSIVTTFVILFLGRQAGLFNTTLNVISLFALMVAVGMLADPAIVVIDAISRRFTDMREDSRTAAIRGAASVTMPIVAGAATTMCVFIPLIFVGATVGGFFRIFGDFALTLCVVIVASLLIALTVVPMVAGVVLQKERRAYSRTMQWLGRSYGRLIRLTLHHRAVSLTVAVGMLGLAFWLYQGIERSPRASTLERQITVNVDVPRAYTIEETRAVMEDMAARLEARRDELEIADLAHEYRTGGGRARGGFGRGGRRFELYLTEESEAERSVTAIMADVREMFPTVPGVTFRIAQSRGHGPGGGGSGIRLDLMGEDMDVLELVSGRVVERLAALPFVRDVDTSLESGTEELHVNVLQDRALATGIATNAVAQSVRSALTSRPVGYIESDRREVDIVVQYPEEERESFEQLERMPVFTSAGRQPIGSMTDFETQQGPRRIEREDRRPKLSITANTTTRGASFRLMGQVEEALADIPLPPGYEWSFDRWTRMGQTDFSAAGFAFAFALLLIYLIMVALFESFIHPAVIMTAIPFSFIGVAATLKLTGQTLGSTAMLGVVLLAGIVVNNAIVLIAHVNAHRRNGMARDDALALGSEHRLRPVLMTAMTTFCGLLPLAAPFFLPGIFGSVDGRAGQWAPIGLVLAGGLPASTFLTLLFWFRRSTRSPTTCATALALHHPSARGVRRGAAGPSGPRDGPGVALRGGDFRRMKPPVSPDVAIPNMTSDLPRRRARVAVSRDASGFRFLRPGSPSRSAPVAALIRRAALRADPGVVRRAAGRARGRGTAVPVESKKSSPARSRPSSRRTGRSRRRPKWTWFRGMGGPLVEIATEEGRYVREGDLLARIDDTEPAAQVEIARVALAQAEVAHERARASVENRVVSQEVYDSARSALDSAAGPARKQRDPAGVHPDRRALLRADHRARGQVRGDRDQRPAAVPDFRLRPAALHDRSAGARPEPARRGPAGVRRGRSVPRRAVSGARPSGEPGGRLRHRHDPGDARSRPAGRLSPGMFATVRLVTDVRADAVLMPRRALSLDSLADTVFVVEDGIARRRNITLGYEEDERVQVLAGLNPGDRVVIVGQDGLTDATPVAIFAGPGAEESPPPTAAAASSPEATEAIRARMRERGMSEEAIDARIATIRRSGGPGGGPPEGTPRAAPPPGGDPPAAAIAPGDPGDPPAAPAPESGGSAAAAAAVPLAASDPAAEAAAPRAPRAPDLTPEELEAVRERLRRQGVSDEDIERRLERGWRAGEPGPPGSGRPGGPPREMTEEAVEALRERLRARGLSEEQIEEAIARRRRPGR